jgi:DNA polymerase III sliding clamp (beta) subunit (PCNA family)
MITLNYSPWLKAKTDFGIRVIESKTLIKWVTKAMYPDDSRPNMRGVQIQSVEQANYDCYWAEIVATDGYRIHHAEVVMPVLGTPNFQNRLYFPRFVDKVTITFTELNETLVLPDWRLFVKEEMFNITEMNCKGNYITDSFLADAIPPKTKDDSSYISIRYKDELYPVIIRRAENRKNYAIVMPSFLG